ncbi:MAG: hypothetical protein ACI90E_002138, partial [Yoonia sp.]
RVLLAHTAATHIIKHNPTSKIGGGQNLTSRKDAMP